MQRVEAKVQVPGRRRDVVHHVVVEGDESHPVPLLPGEIGETGRQVPCIVQLRDGVAPVAHGPGHIQENHEVGVRLGLEELDVVPVGPAEETPVDAPDVIPGHVGAVLGEVQGKAQVDGPMEAVQEPLHHLPGQKLQVVDPGQDLGKEELGP